MKSDWDDPLNEGLFWLHEQIASSNGAPVHGRRLVELIPEYAQPVMTALQDPETHARLLSILHEVRLIASIGYFGMEAGSQDDFPPSLRAKVRAALFVAKVCKAKATRVDDDPPFYAFAFLPDGEVITANEPSEDGYLNPWPI